MFKLIAAIGLSLSLVFLVKEAVIALRSGNLPASVMQESGREKLQKSFPAQEEVSFYPHVPYPLPDLNQGYLFNEERMIAVAGGGNNNTPQKNTTGPTVDMDTVFYAGSIIVGDVRKGLVMYRSPKANTLKRRIPPGRPPLMEKERNYVQLAVGDHFSGYKVVEVEPDHIIFRKGPESIEKNLNDPDKERIPAPVPSKSKITKTRKSISNAKNVKRSATTSSTSGSKAESINRLKSLERRIQNN